MTNLKKNTRFSQEESVEWLRARLSELGISGLDELQELSGIDKGSLSRYFRQERTPRIDVIAPLCESLKVSPETLLIALGAIGRKGRN